MTAELHPADLDRLKAALAVLPPRPIRLAEGVYGLVAQAVAERLREEDLDATAVVGELRSVLEEARGLVEMLRPVAEARLLEAAEVAELLKVSVGHVYRHAAEFGGVRVGDGPRAPLRFKRLDIERRLKKGPFSNCDEDGA